MNRLSTAYPTATKAHGFTAAERSTDEVFRRARRHSRRVRLLRILIPVLLLLAIAVAVLAVLFNPLRFLTELPINIAGLSITSARMTMTEPQLAGYTRDKRRYELTANSAVQDFANADIVNLDEPRASIEMSDRSTIKMQAASGMFDRKEGVLTLRRDIMLTSSAGYEIRLQEAIVDVRTGNIVSNQPVELGSQHGTLRGNRLEVMKSGEIIRLDGDVILNFTPPPEDPGEKNTQ